MPSYSRHLFVDLDNYARGVIYLVRCMNPLPPPFRTPQQCNVCTASHIEPTTYTQKETRLLYRKHTCAKKKEEENIRVVASTIHPPIKLSHGTTFN